MIPLKAQKKAPQGGRMAWKGEDWTEEGRREGQDGVKEEGKGRRLEGGERDYSGRLYA